jgi:alpha-D-ribose 1-methylphosphonate 5-triphosphate synthase subunit PhnI
VQHLKLPHYVDFQADLQHIRRLRREFFQRQTAMKEAAE